MMRNICLKVLSLSLITVLVATTYTMPALALSEEQQKLYDRGIMYYDLNDCDLSPPPVSDPASSVVSDDTAELAKQMLANSNITYWTNNGVNTRDVVVDLSEGRKGKTTAPDGQQAEAAVNPSILKFILEAAQSGKVMVNALTDKDHSTNSNHYKGLAVDLDSGASNTTVSVGKLIEIAKKYGGEKNNEGDHHHFDFTTVTPSTGNKNLYMVGDSITVGAKKDLLGRFKDKGYKPYVNASVSRSITSAGTTDGFKTSGITAIEGDKERISQSDAIIVALGTNPSDDFEESLKNLVQKVRGYSPNARVFWVNLFATDKNLDHIASYNKVIEKNASSSTYTVIDTISANIKTSDGVHPVDEGVAKYAKTVVDGLAGESRDVASAKTGSCSCEAASGGSSTLSGSDNAEKIFNFFVEQGLKPHQAAGIMGNMFEESGLNPRALQPSTTGDAPIAGRGYGLVQWTFPARQDPLIKKAKDSNRKVYELGLQLEYVMDELTSTHKEAYELLKASKDSDAATIAIETKYEIHAGVPNNLHQIRRDKAKEYLAKFGSGSSSGASTTGDTTACSRGGDGENNNEVTGAFSLPVAKKWYTKNKEWFTKPHHDYPAADIPVPSGTAIFSMTDGKVIQGPTTGDCGVGIIIDSPDGVRYTYCHGSDGGSISGAKQGDTVKAGQRIMTSGNTGESSGPHLHLQINVDGVKKCPQQLFVSIASGNPVPIKSLPESGCTN